jgi:hypothetical protein
LAFSSHPQCIYTALVMYTSISFYKPGWKRLPTPVGHETAGRRTNERTNEQTQWETRIHETKTNKTIQEKEGERGGG